jgi:integrase/truncated hemoglobin YjbI
VPKRLVERAGRREIVVSLATGEFRLARLRSRHIYIASEVLFAKLGTPMLNDETIKRVVSEFYSLVGEIDQLGRLSAPPLSGSEHAALVPFMEGHLAATKAELGRGDYALAGTGAEIVLARLGMRVDHLELRQVQQAIMRTGIETIRAAQARLSGDFGHDPGDPLVRAAIAGGGQGDVTTNPSIQSLGRAELPPDKPVTVAANLFGELSDLFLTHQTKGRVWDKQTAAQAKKTYSLWKEVCGDRQLVSYDRASAQKFKDVMQDLPWDYGKAAEFRGKGIPEIVRIDEARSPKSERLATRTVKRHFAALSGLWKWAMSEGIASNNPFLGFAFPSMLRANEQRDMWSLEELETLFSTPVWLGCRSEVRRSAPGTVVIRDEKFWLPIIAVFSGLRQEEIAQLHLEDIRAVDGHLVFDINARPPRKLKNRNAVRKVPVHSTLLRLGLLDYIKDLKGAEAVLLFPNLRAGGADDRLGHAFSKWFTRYRKDVGVYRKGLDFHSLRHTTTTTMQRAGVPIAAIDELTGHATPGETARYSHGLSMSQLVEAIESIRLPLPF